MRRLLNSDSKVVKKCFPSLLVHNTIKVWYKQKQKRAIQIIQDTFLAYFLDTPSPTWNLVTLARTSSQCDVTFLISSKIQAFSRS
jgi:hypothetical protein